MMEKQKHRPERRHGLPLVGPGRTENLARKETRRRVAMLPPPGSSFNEKMLDRLLQPDHKESIVQCDALGILSRAALALAARVKLGLLVNACRRERSAES